MLPWETGYIKLLWWISGEGEGRREQESYRHIYIVMSICVFMFIYNFIHNKYIWIIKLDYAILNLLLSIYYLSSLLWTFSNVKMFKTTISFFSIAENAILSICLYLIIGYLGYFQFLALSTVLQWHLEKNPFKWHKLLFPRESFILVFFGQRNYLYFQSNFEHQNQCCNSVLWRTHHMNPAEVALPSLGSPLAHPPPPQWSLSLHSIPEHPRTL